MCRKMLQFIRNYSTKSKAAYYVTTPIYYVNAVPHIGHLYSSVIADAVQRWQSVRNADITVSFATGTDEHGTKVQQAAAAHKMSPAEYCNLISDKYKDLARTFSVNYTDFIRTTEERHVNAVQQFWKAISKNDNVYVSKYAGWYCVSDETFLTDSQLKEFQFPDGKKALVSAESGHTVEWTEEENYMFKLSAFRADLKHWLATNENAVMPKKFHKVLLDTVTGEDLRDVSISRPTSRVHWGVRVPEDSTQTVYVWLDALVNYLTVAGYPNTQADDFRLKWPADLHVIGKDILKFHGIYWPAFLMAANLEPPRTLLCHSHWTVDGEKMSKSKHNVVNPFDRSELYTPDGLRYFLLREGVSHSDGNYSDTKVMRILNSELADTLGNLLSRCCGSVLNVEQVFPAPDENAFQIVASMEVAKKLIDSVSALPEVCVKHYDSFNFYKVADSVVATLHSANLFFETMKPWELRKSPETRHQLDVTLHLAMETLRISSILLQPLIPNLADKLLTKLNIPKTERYLSNAMRLSWRNEFQTRSLSDEKLILFKRIKHEDQPQKTKEVCN